MGFFKSMAAPRQVQTPAPQNVEEDKKKAKASRAALLETQGGIQGQELNQGEVKKRDNLFGN